jgi:hypothetical protein
MEEEIKQPKSKLSYLDEVRKEKAELEKVRDELRIEREKFEELKANEILGGKSEAGNQQKEKKPEISNREYAQNALKGKI